ncbi:hypothetical protein JCM19236_1131 [Vibrio sp. JCM 19236]|nr:hypothetical protein JCM19236_1131 [Vibrio sp. JCM 19236]
MIEAETMDTKSVLLGLVKVFSLTLSSVAKLMVLKTHKATA